MVPAKVPLSPEERALPYAKYFDKPLALPDVQKLVDMVAPVHPSVTLPVDQRNDLLNPGYLPCEVGWCQMPDGTGFIANVIQMKGVTTEMINWWFAWHALEPVRYKIWYPPCHYDIQLSPRDREKVLDPARSLVEKFQGLTHMVVEDTFGPGPERIAIEFKTPEDFGFDMARFKAPFASTFAGGHGAAQSLFPPPGAPNFKAPAVMCHIVREIPDGIEFRTRFWMGYRIVNKKAVRCIPPDVRIPPFIIRGLATHNVHEYANLASFLPQLFEEQKGQVA